MSAGQFSHQATGSSPPVPPSSTHSSASTGTAPAAASPPPAPASPAPPDPPDPPQPALRSGAPLLTSRLALLRRVALHSPSLKALNQLPANSYDLLQLIKDGSVKVHRLQHVFSRAIALDAQKRLLARTTDQPERARLLSLFFKNPFPTLDLTDTACRLDNAATVATARRNLGLHATSQIALDPNARCVCGTRLHDDPHHFTGCSQLSRLQVNCHDDGYKAIAESFEACGIHVRTEHQLKGTQQRVDVSYTHPLTGQRVHIDFTIVNPAAMSIAHAVKLPNMTAMRPLFSREASKRNKHEAYARAEGYDFFPWVVDPYGATTFTARKLIQSALSAATLTRSRTAPTAKQFLDRISAAVFRGTAAIIAEGVQRSTSSPVAS